MQKSRIYRLLFLKIFFLVICSCSKKNNYIPFFNDKKILKKQKIIINNIINKKFVIVIPSFNNQKWYKYNLDSIFRQNYTNYRIIYIDDNSNDNTYNCVKNYIKLNKKLNIKLIKNKKKLGALANHYYAIQMCNDDEIIVSLDGDDWFAHSNVLNYLNNIYQNKNIWLTYGQFINWPTNNIGWCKDIPKNVINNNMFREFGFCSAQPRTYYAWLAKKIKIHDLQINDTFFTVAGDVALMFPMLEMASTRFKFIPDILYIRNVLTPLNDFKVNKNIQIETTKLIRNKKKYLKI